ncbi:putative carboxymethylenebutenolidase, partial [Paramagnetospirillum caucaseum]
MALLSWAGPARAQAVPSASEMRAGAAQAPDLVFPSEISTLAEVTTRAWPCSSPRGPAPFPHWCCTTSAAGWGRASAP